MEKHTERLGSAPLPSLLLKLSLPGIVATIFGSVYNLVDTFWVAKLGYKAIAALTIIFPYQILAIAVGIGTGTGLSALVSRYFGEKKIEQANQAAGQIFLLSIFWGILFILIPLLFSDTILTLFGATPDIFDISKTYLIITAFGAPFFVFDLLAGNLVRGSGEAVKPTVIMITGSIVNIFLDPLLIFGVGPFPEMGIKGAALATVISQAIGTCIGLYFLLANKTIFRFNLQCAVPHWKILKGIYKVGAPASIQQITESFAFILFNKLVSGFGSIPIAAIGLAMRLSDFAFMPIIGVSNALMPVIGYNLGAGNEKRLWKAIKISTIGIVMLLALFTLIIEIWTPQIISIFSNDQELLSVAIPAMRIMLSTLIFIGPGILFITAFQGLSKGNMALFLSLIRQFILLIPLLLIMRYLFGLTGIWLALPLSDVFSFLIMFIFLYREYHKRNKL